MKLTELQKDFRNCVDKALQSKDEVFTLQEMYDLCVEKEYPCTLVQVKSYLHGHAEMLNVRGRGVYGNQEALRKAKKVLSL